MQSEVLRKFRGITELDETYIGGQRKNKKLHIRRIKAKKGHGTDKVAIVGLLNRPQGKVYVEIIPKLDIKRIFEITREKVVKGSQIFTDGYKMYRGFPRHGYRHEYVDHDDGEYVRGKVHTNNIEGFWGILKRNLGCIGGVRRKYLHLFVAEIVWKFNHREEPKEIQEKQLFHLLKNYKFGGRK
jgi:transposase-like protein